MSSEKTSMSAPVHTVVMRPVDEGWYWYRNSDQHVWTPCKLFFTPTGMMVTNFRGDENFIENYPGQWVRIYEPSV